MAEHSSKPMPVPGLVAGSCYCVAVACTVLFRLAVKRYKLFPAVLGLCLCLQIGAITVVPLAVLIIRWRGGLKSEGPSLAWLPRRGTLVGLVLLVGLHHVVYSNFTELEVWQLSSALEAFAFAVLVARIFMAQSAAGISAQKLILDALRLSCRLAASYWLGRQMPRRSADAFAQAFDICSIVLVCGSLYGVLVHFRNTYQATADTLTAPLPALIALGLALVLRADVGRNFVPDALLTMSLYLEAAAPLPQLRLVAMNGGAVDEATSHHLAGLFCSRLLALTFWWCIRTTWPRGMQFCGWLILVAGVLPLIVLWHYMCYYLRALFTRSMGSGVPLICDEG